MRLLIVAIGIALCGCSQERAQLAADARSGILAAQIQMHAGKTDEASAILIGVDRRLPAVAEVPTKDWPMPAMSPASIAEAPRQYVESAPPEPKGGMGKILAVAGGIGASLLFIIGRLAPGLPGAGPVIGKVADVAWNVLAHRDQKATDQAAAVVTENAKVLALILDAAKGFDGIGRQITPELDAAVKKLAGRA